MTERSNFVESPFERRRVQVTIACFALLLCSRGLLEIGKTRTRVWEPWEQSVAARTRASLGPGDTSARESNSAVPLLQIDINVAQPREFALLPGVGPVLAKRIVQNRAQYGPFETVQCLSRIRGIGPKTIGHVRRYCTVEETVLADPPSPRLGASTADPKPQPR